MHIDLCRNAATLRQGNVIAASESTAVAVPNRQLLLVGRELRSHGYPEKAL